MSNCLSLPSLFCRCKCLSNSWWLECMDQLCYCCWSITWIFAISM